MLGKHTWIAYQQSYICPTQKPNWSSKGKPSLMANNRFRNTVLQTTEQPSCNLARIRSVLTIVVNCINLGISNGHRK